MKFAFLKPDNLFTKYTAAKQYTDSLTDPFPEFERLARNKHKEGIDPRYPKTTDGTTASIIRKTPKRVVQQLPTGKVESGKPNDWLPIVAEFIYTNEILPYANEEYDLIQKCWTAVEKGLTFGSTAIYTPFLSHDGHFSPDMTIPYWGDIMIQPGKKSGYSCDYIFMRSWWKEEDIDALIDREKKLRKENKDYESTWDLEALEEVKAWKKEKDEKARTPSDNDRKVHDTLIEVVTGLQTGVKAKFYTFVPQGDDKANEAVSIIRTKENKDPRGKIPIDWMYGDIDGSNPLGRGIVELIGGLQNLIDSDMQMYQYNRALALAPPLLKRGSFNSKKVVFAPNAIIDMGINQQNSLETLSVDTSALVNYPNLYGLQKSQLLNLVTSPDTSISSEVGNPGFGKTPQAINAQQANISIDDNYVRKMFEAAFSNWSETAINLYFAERKGKEELQLDENTAESLRKLAEKGYFDLSTLSNDNKIIIDYSTATPALKFRVDASTSKMKDDGAQGEILLSLSSIPQQNPAFANLIPQEKWIAVWNRIVATSGVEDPEDLTVDIEEWKQQQEMAMQEQMAQEQAMLAEQAQQPIEGEIVPEMPVEAPVEPPIEEMPQESMDQEDLMIIEELRAMGLPDSIVSGAIQLLNSGATAEQVMAEIQGVMSNG